MESPLAANSLLDPSFPLICVGDLFAEKKYSVRYGFWCCGVVLSVIEEPRSPYCLRSLMMRYKTGALATIHDANISKLANCVHVQFRPEEGDER
jgi:hypothetical protein